MNRFSQDQACTWRAFPTGCLRPPPTGRARCEGARGGGAVVAREGFDLLLDAFHAVTARHPDWQLWIFGEGPSRNALSTQIESLGLSGRAHLKGMTPHLNPQLAAASVFILSSRFEGLPMALLEAMAAGLPTVAFDCRTGPAEVIDDGTSGLLVPTQDTAALAAGICELIENPLKRRAMGAAALKDSEHYLAAAHEKGRSRDQRRTAATSV